MVTNEFAINHNDTMVAVSQFATTSRTEIFFNQYPDKESLLNAIARIHWMNGESNTHMGLFELAHRVFQVKNYSIHIGHHGHQTVTYGPRSESAKIAIVLTDGRSLEPDQTIRTANQLHNMGVEVFVIGMGHWVDGTELQQIATDRDHVYRISSTNDLASIHSNIVDAICKCTSIQFCSCNSFLGLMCIHELLLRTHNLFCCSYISCRNFSELYQKCISMDSKLICYNREKSLYALNISLNCEFFFPFCFLVKVPPPTTTPMPTTTTSKLMANHYNDVIFTSQWFHSFNNLYRCIRSKYFFVTVFVKQIKLENYFFPERSFHAFHLFFT